jgi:DNA-binding transcriptional LysR family regulator
MRANWHSLREFEAFRALIASGTATAAARRLGVSQSAVSRAVAQLEARLGLQLFERAGARLSPTAEALAFNANLDGLFEALSKLDRSRWSGPAFGMLRLAAPATLAHGFLPRRIASFIELNPDQRISLEVLASDALVTGVAEGRFDLALTDTEVNHSGVRTELLRSSEAVCVMPAGHALMACDVVTPADLRDVPFVALTRRHSVRGTIDRIFAEAGVEPRIVVDTATSASAWELVRLRVGVAVMNPFPVLQAGMAGLALRPFAPRVTHRMQFLTPAAAPVTPAARLFVRHVRRLTPRDDPASAHPALR